MSLNNIQSPGRDLDDEQSRRWSTKTVASTSLENGLREEKADPTTPSKARQITAETLSWLPKGHSALHAHLNAPTDEHFHERQADLCQEDNHLNTKRVAAMELSLQQCSDIITRRPAELDAQAETLSGLQMHMKPDPAPGIPAHLLDELEPNPPPWRCAAPVGDPDDQEDDNAFYAFVQDAYATAYHLQPADGTRLGSALAETMRREAAMDDAVFRPPTRTIPMEARRAGEDPGPVVVRRLQRKRKREDKSSE